MIARDKDEYLRYAEGASKLEAARQAKRIWEEEMGPGRRLSLHPEDSVRISDGVETDHESAQSSRRESIADAARVAATKDETFTITWLPTDDPDDHPNPFHYVEVKNGEGEILQAGVGDDVEDSAIESILAMLPTWAKRDD